MGKTLYDKVYDAHIVCANEGETPILYIDRHLLHEVTSPQAFAGLEVANREVRRPNRTWATMDHNVSTLSSDINACGELGRIQMQTLIDNCKKFGVPLYGLGHKWQGIVHVIGPQIG